MLPPVKMHVHALSIVLINVQLLLFYSRHDNYMYVRKTKMLSLMCWVATSMLKYSSMTKIEIADLAIFLYLHISYYLLHQLGTTISGSPHNAFSICLVSKILVTYRYRAGSYWPCTFFTPRVFLFNFL